MQEKFKKNNAWNTRLLVNETIVPLTQRITLKNVEFQVSGNPGSVCCDFI